MCELFGVSAHGKTYVNDYLREFFSHSNKHPNGWGIAEFYAGGVSLEKEPIEASKSAYLRERLKYKVDRGDMMAHIRFATRGMESYENSHPFVKTDNFGRTWTFEHNGTIFNYPTLDPYFYSQEGQTDSERIILYIIDKINAKQTELNRPLSETERFAVIDKITASLAKGNKLNFLLYDGEIMYVHCNAAGFLHCLKKDESMIFATTPLSREEWRPVKFTTLLAYKNGKLIKTGTDHKHEYKENASDYHMLFVDYSSL